MNIRFNFIMGNTGNRSRLIVFLAVALFLVILAACNLPSPSVVDWADPDHEFQELPPGDSTSGGGLGYEDSGDTSSSQGGFTGGDTSSDSREEGPLKPVGFINHGMYNATVRAWTWIPLGAEAQDTPPEASTVSTASTSPGLWPNPSRFLSLPLGTYTWCIEWDEGDIDDDGLIDYFYYIDDHPLTLDESSSDDLDMAVEVDISAPPSQAIVNSGTCGQAAVQFGQSIRLIDGDIRSSQNPPGVFVYASPGYANRPDGFSVITGGSTSYWEAWIFLYDNGWIEITNLVDVNSMGVQFWGDFNDGWARVIFDGTEIWSGDTYGPSLPDPNSFVKYLEISNVSPGSHTLRVQHMGIPGVEGGTDVTVLGFGFRLTDE